MLTWCNSMLDAKRTATPQDHCLVHRCELLLPCVSSSSGRKLRHMPLANAGTDMLHALPGAGSQQDGKSQQQEQQQEEEEEEGQQSMALSGSDSDAGGDEDEEVAHQRALRGEALSWRGLLRCVMSAV